MIEASGLTKRYDKTLAVDDLSFSIRPGTVTGFLGPNGSGKSTTMRMILGLDRPTEGDVRIDGRHYRELKRPLTKVGAMLDAKWVHPNRSARAHLRWLAKSNRLPARRVDEVLELVGLSAVARRRAGGFSLGMAQRLGIAAALLGDPEILLFDEPVNGLDPEGILWIRQLMQRMAGEGRTVLVSSHLLSEMALTAKELVVIGRGRLIAQCSTAEFVDQASDATVLVRTPQRERLRSALRGERIKTAVSSSAADELIVSGSSARIGEIAAAAGVVLHELTSQRASLEEAFLALTNESVEFQAQGERRPELIGAGTGSAARQEANR
ncbi:ABC-2 type transport system ATP-binding protein [Actinoalloteichus hoggarensis]|uniref:Putative ABC transporter ATP-binding protein YxlF n=1 Tax=Actinoalloteichus hoggarensis TaxID=1470176 RepID=A0A221WCQ8_9PSEU|nr:ABC transporter ATP-binding protein [Actinoalloteichus hoggarensis]ASO23057.1 putative ABC transporter ATP-binding protein YxlF [Actinoalloteichus hoggarensis]MBB5922662.1 ABC-2 type transport system ATP-binding protein [Actinoalloteichus hoggarensis]